MLKVEVLYLSVNQIKTPFPLTLTHEKLGLGFVTVGGLLTFLLYLVYVLLFPALYNTVYKKLLFVFCELGCLNFLAILHFAKTNIQFILFYLFSC